jgi:glycosyltransferase involved in cell wall biosynthesis
MLLSVIIPIYNEEKNLEENIEFHIKQLLYLENNVELILVNDASTDGTDKIIDKLLLDKRILIRKKVLNVNSGTGQAIFEGIKISNGKYVFHNSCDLAYRYKNFNEIINKLEDFDLIIVSRFDRKANSPWRTATSITWNYLSRKVLNLPFKDMNFVQFYRRKYIDEMNYISLSPASLTISLINYFYKKKYKILEIKSTFHKREFNKAKYGKFRDILENFFSLIKIKLNEFKNS